MTSTAAATVFGIAAYMVMIFIIGLMAFKKNKSGDANDWFLMGRKTNLIMLVGTLFATWFSTFAFLGGPGTFYLNGVNWLLFGFFNSMGPLLVMIIGTRVWKLGKEYGFITPADLLSSYYDDSLRLRKLTGIVCIIVLFPYATIQLSGISIALQSISGGFITYEMSIFGLAICVAAYAIFGGSRAVVWTDAIQGFIFAGLLIATATFVVIWSGGWTFGWERAIATDPEKFYFQEGSSGGTYITLMLLWTFGWILTPHLWQRLYMADSAKTLVQSSIIASFLALIVVTFSGAVIGFLAMGLDLNIPQGFTSDALVPLLYSEHFPIMGAVLVVAVFAAGMSTLDSQIISASSIYSLDYHKHQFKKSTESSMMKASRWFELAFILAVIAFSLSETGRQLLIPLASVGVGLALVFLMPLIGALFWPRASEAAAFWAMLSGTIVMLTLQFGIISYMPGSIGPAMWGFITSATVFYTVSHLTSPVSEEKQMMFHGLLSANFPEYKEAKKAPKTKSA